MVVLCTEDWPGRLLGRLDEVLVIKQMFPEGVLQVGGPQGPPDRGRLDLDAAKIFPLLSIYLNPSSSSIYPSILSIFL